MNVNLKTKEKGFGGISSAPRCWSKKYFARGYFGKEIRFLNEAAAGIQDCDRAD